MAEHKQLMACYFRSWRDTTNDSAENQACMAELPEEVDIAFVFPNGEETSGFWEKLGAEVIPCLHGKGIRVVRTVFIDELINPKFADTEEGYQALADHVLERFLLSTPGLDGLDVDLEKNLNDAQRKKAHAVSLHLSSYLKKHGKLFIYDTSELGDVELLRSLEPSLDYLLLQAYGQNPERVQAHFDRLYASFLPIEKFMVGFSFYEERGQPWWDTTPSLEASTACKYAMWQPTQGRKAGMFSYATDRDGVKEGSDALQPTRYEWTRQLKRMMR